MTEQRDLLPPDERYRRAAEKRERILAWLSDEGWSSVPVLADALGLTVEPTRRALRSLMRDGLVRRQELSRPQTRPLVVYTLTPHGSLMASDPGDSEVLPEHYTPRLSVVSFEHGLGVQQARIQAERAGWTEWCGTRRAKARAERYGWPKVPDAIGRDPEGQVVAIEVERTAKTPRRYREIVAMYLQMTAGPELDRVQYLCPDPRLVPRLRGLWERIDYVVIDGKRWPVKDEHRERFSFAGLENWPETEDRDDG
jgi:hypothetical protein